VFLVPSSSRAVNPYLQTLLLRVSLSRLDGKHRQSSRAGCFPKTLFAFFRCSIPKAKGFGDLLTRSPVHTGARDEEDYGGGAAARGGKTLTQIDDTFDAAYGLDI